MRWQKIVLNEKEPTVHLEYQLAASGGFNDLTYTSHEAPHPDFVNAMAAIADAVIQIAELKGVAEPEDITVRSVSLGHKKVGKTSVVITALRTLKNSSGPMLINTPLKYIVPDDAADDGSSDEKLDKGLALKIDLLCVEARAFFEDNKRAQGDLFQKPEAKQNSRRPRAEDGFQPDQADLEMETIGETVTAIHGAIAIADEALGQSQTRNDAAEGDSPQADSDSTPGGDLEAAFGVSTNGHVHELEAQLMDRKTAALNQVQSWLDYKEYCLTFGLAAKKGDFDNLIASRDPAEQRPGYRDPLAAQNREARRRAAKAVLENAGVASDDDLRN